MLQSDTRKEHGSFTTAQTLFPKETHISCYSMNWDKLWEGLPHCEKMINTDVTQWISICTSSTPQQWLTVMSRTRFLSNFVWWCMVPECSFAGNIIARYCKFDCTLLYCNSFSVQNKKNDFHCNTNWNFETVQQYYCNTALYCNSTKYGIVLDLSRSYHGTD